MDEQTYRMQVLEKLDLILAGMSGIFAVGLAILACLAPLPIDFLAGLLSGVFLIKSVASFLTTWWKSGYGRR
jgi:hypothetical protein